VSSNNRSSRIALAQLQQSLLHEHRSKPRDQLEPFRFAWQYQTMAPANVWSIGDGQQIGNSLTSFDIRAHS
jgi:hypothetical protein